ncbi:MAG: gluconate 2-dehydrogenase subunit 3 family protein [Acidimicrobiia bacterium]
MEINRRQFVIGAGLTPLLRYVPASMTGAASAQEPQESFRFFDEHQAAVVREATARLIPGPSDDPAEAGHPGAREAGVVVFIDLFLSAFDDDPPRIFAGGPWSNRHGGAENEMQDFVPLSAYEEEKWRAHIDELRQRYVTGIAALDEAAGGDFTAVPPEKQDAVLVDDTPDGFRGLLFQHAIEGTYSVPEYGGNRALVGWSETASAGDVAPIGWSAEETSESDGPDPAPPGVALPFPAEAADAASKGEQVLPEGGEPAVAQRSSLGPDADEVIGDPETFLSAALPGLGRSRNRRRTRG